MANVQLGTKGFQRRPLIERFQEKVDQRGPDECWPWTGAHDGHGRGQIWVEGKNVRAPRVAWELANGTPFPDELDACHICDNPRCVNPAHIWPGTPSENALDAVAKGRLVSPGTRGYKNYNALKTHCGRGHPLAGENIRINKLGRRICRACMRILRQRSYRKLRAALNEDKP